MKLLTTHYVKLLCYINCLTIIECGLKCAIPYSDHFQSKTITLTSLSVLETCESTTEVEACGDIIEAMLKRNLSSSDEDPRVPSSDTNKNTTYIVIKTLTKMQHCKQTFTQIKGSKTFFETEYLLKNQFHIKFPIQLKLHTVWLT